jgi:hypothetical protein
MVDTSTDGLLISEGIIHPVDRASVVAWFIRYLHYYYYYYHSDSNSNNNVDI